MTLELVTIPCLTDNYAYLVHNVGKRRDRDCRFS